MKGRGIAAVGVALGLAAVVTLAIIAFVAGARSQPAPQTMQTAALLFFEAAPFLLALLGFRVRSSAMRGGIWVGAGIVSIVLPVVIFSFASLLVLPGGIALLVAGSLTHGGIETSKYVATLAVVIAVGAIATSSWFLLRESHCWYRTANGWVERPYSTTIRGGSASPGQPRTFEGTCGSTPTTVGLGLGAATWVAAAVATAAASRRVRDGEPVPA